MGVAVAGKDALRTQRLSEDPYGLQRFVDAQSVGYAEVERELTAGRKTSHWMWFVFPQLAGLGTSSMARRYAIGSLAEARAYLNHPLLGTRLRSATALVLEAGAGTEAAPGRMSAARIFGHTDALKFHSSMTLFALAAGTGQIFETALECFFASTRDPATLALL